MVQRSPLKEKNIQNPVRQNALTDARSPSKPVKHAHTGADELNLRTWQRHWREIMSRSIFYFHQLDRQSQERVTPTIMSVGAKIQTFFDREVTIVISNSKPNESTSSNDTLAIARRHEMKIWNFDKLVRFLTYLGHSPAKTVSEAPSQKLSHLLKEEKLLGHHADRDPATKREDYYYFKNPYILVWDPLHHHRPTLCKEYTRRGPSDDDGDWPRMKLTEPGRCVFLVDDHETHRRQQIQATPTHVKNNSTAVNTPVAVDSITINAPSSKRKKHKQVDDSDEVQPDANSDDHEHDEDCENDIHAKKIILKDQHGMAMPVALASNNPANNTNVGENGAIPADRTTSNASTAYKFYEIAASGVSRSNNSTIASIAMSGELNRQNGLAAPTTQVPSKEIALLKRKVLSRSFGQTLKPSNTQLSRVSKQTQLSTALEHPSPLDHARQLTGGLPLEVEEQKETPPNEVIAVEPEIEPENPRPDHEHKQADDKRSPKQSNKRTDTRSLRVRKLPEYERDRDQRGGYCENCRENFDKFIDHVNSAKHRNFAIDSKNFERLDEFISLISR